MDARANTAASAVAVVVSFFGVCKSSVLGSEERPAQVVVGIEDVRVGEAFWVVVQSPYVQKDGTSFGDVHTVDSVIWILT